MSAVTLPSPLQLGGSHFKAFFSGDPTSRTGQIVINCGTPSVNSIGHQAMDKRTSFRKPPLHIFLSYARGDEFYVDRLRTDLQKHGLPIWIDTERLGPGTPNWERSLRRALEHSYAAILTASSSS